MRMLLTMDRPTLVAAPPPPPVEAPGLEEPVEDDAENDPVPGDVIVTPAVRAVGIQGKPSTIDRTGLRPFHAVGIVEDVWTGDGRWFVGGSIGWRDLPLPLMAQDWTDEAHMNAVLVGNIDRIERIGTELHLWGVWAATAEADRYYDLVDQNMLRGISVDLDDFEFELLIPESMTEFDETAPPTITDDGDLVVAMDDMRMRVTKSRLMGATVVPFPALSEAFFENLTDALPALAASAGVTGMILDRPCLPCADDQLVAAAPTPYVIQPPIAPPNEWLDDPKFTALTPYTITDEGRVYGHLAAWGSCHIGFVNECVTPPHSLSNYANFHTGELIMADGQRCAVGNITMDTGHAPLSASAPRAVQHYDDTGWAVADVRCGEDDYGIWMAGALRTGIDPARVRALMASDLSGDWRRIGQGLELVAALAVNVPGFHKPRPTIKAHSVDGLLASLVASLPIAVVDAPTPILHLPDAAADRLRASLAASVGRTPDARRAELAARIHGAK